MARAKPVVPAAQQVAWSALARCCSEITVESDFATENSEQSQSRCSHTRSQRRRLLHGALLAAAGDKGQAFKIGALATASLVRTWASAHLSAALVFFALGGYLEAFHQGFYLPGAGMDAA